MLSVQPVRYMNSFRVQFVEYYVRIVLSRCCEHHDLEFLAQFLEKFKQMRSVVYTYLLQLNSKKYILFVWEVRIVHFEDIIVLISV